MSQLLMKFILGEFIIIGIVCGIEGRWPMALYWCGASIIQLGIVWGIK